MQELYNQIISEARSAWRFRWLALAAAWLVCIGGWYWVATQPDAYRASARVYVDTSSELRRLLGGQIVEQDVSAQLSFVRQSLLGRVLLSEVARSTGLADRARSDEELQGIVDGLRSAIGIQSAGGGRNAQDNVFAISFEHRNRQMAIDVVDRMLTTFVEDTLSGGRESSASARRFLEQQVGEYEQRLSAAEERLAQFRRENYDRLPGSQGGYFSQLQGERNALEEAAKELELAQSRRERIQQRLRGEAPAVIDGLTGGGDEGNSLAARIREYEARLEELLLRYTQRHPEVLATRETLEELRARRADELTLMAAVDHGPGPIASNNPVYQALQISLNEAEVEIATLEAALADRQRRVDRLQSLIDEVPAVEAQLARLDRDYGVVHAQYQNLLQSLERERLSREAHETESVEFRIIDPPVAGFEPVAPDRPRLLSMVLIAGLGVGGGLSFLLAQIRPVFQSTRLLREVTGLPVLGAVSLTRRAYHRARRRLAVLTFFMGGGALVAAFVGVFLAETSGPGMMVLMERLL